MKNNLIEKPWGHEEIIHNDKYVVKKLLMKKGCRCSLQYHEYKTETIIVLNGLLTIELEDKFLELKKDETITIHPFQKHRMSAKENDCLYLETSTTELDDVIRLEDDYKRI
jgi:mannose-6-phosphate isomerase-like protein (cupin superfamily)